MESQREKAAARFRNQVITRELSAIRFLEQSWRLSMRRLQKDIDNLTRQIEKARLEGKKVNRDWLRRQNEYRRLQSNIIKEADKLSSATAAKLREETSWAARKGADDSLKLIQMSFATEVQGLVTFRSMPIETVIEIASRVTPRSPTGQLLGKLGRDAAKKSREVLIDGITRGENVRVIASDLAKAANMPISRARTIANTEIFGAYTDANHEQMKTNADILESWIWMCQIGTACGGCLAMHGQEVEIGTSMKKHVNCHCEQIPKPKTFASLGLPAFLDDEYPDTMQPAAMQEAARAQIDNATQKELQARFGKTKGRLLSEGTVDLDDLKTVVPNKKWGDATIETPLKNLTGWEVTK